jgi:predicted GIY-YIG superfamily endonuclease
MRDAGDKVLYVGKAKDLKQRLNNYRVANPDRMPRRHLKMVREVAHIEFQFCPSEAAALKRESKLLRLLKPRFNRAGVWPGKTRFIVWRLKDQQFQLGVVETPEPDWRRFGPLNGSARELHSSLVRLIWLALNRDRPASELPVGWLRSDLPATVTIQCGQSTEEIATALDTFFWRSPQDFVLWLGSRFCERIHAFERIVIESELEILRKFSAKQKQAVRNVSQLALL